MFQTTRAQRRKGDNSALVKALAGAVGKLNVSLEAMLSPASVVQRAEIEWGGIIARHARGRFALNSGKRVNFTNFIELLARRGFP